MFGSNDWYSTDSTASSVSCSRVSDNSSIQTSPIAVPSATAVAAMTDIAVTVLSGEPVVVAIGSQVKKLSIRCAHTSSVECGRISA